MKNTSHLLLLSLLWLAVALPSWAQRTKLVKPTAEIDACFAIVIDKASYEATKKELLSYRDALQKDGLATYIMVGSWTKPDPLAQEIRQLHADTKGRLEGMVLVGDIPIAMVFNAQHMTSAFKIDEERFGPLRGSVPTDRFYDDFDLNFEYLEASEEQPHVHHYKLTGDGTQTVQMDLYSGRVYPPLNDPDRHEQIARWFVKAAAAKNNPTALDRAMGFHGHGYYSESLSAWADEQLAWREQMPQLYGASGYVRFYHHEMKRNIKEVLLREMQSPDLDLAVFHAHGTPELQLLLGTEGAQSLSQYVERIQQSLRYKWRSAVRRELDTADFKAYFQDKYGIPPEWYVPDAHDSAMVAQDSIRERAVDMYFDDIRQAKPQVDFVVFDECFNGAFFQPDGYIASEYVLREGGSVSAFANTVNCLQDRYVLRDIGMMHHGTRVGQWARHSTHLLEYHIIGDPTFHFAAPSTSPNLQALYNGRPLSEQVYREFLASSDPALVTLAAKEMIRLEGEQAADALAQLFRTSPYFTVRVEALGQLARTRSDLFHQVLEEAVYDPYEYIRRMAVTWMGLVGHERYLDQLVEVYVMDPSARMGLAVRTAFTNIGPDKARQALKNYLATFPDRQWVDGIIHYADIAITVDDDERLMATRLNDEDKRKSDISAIKLLRNQKKHWALDNLFAALHDPETTPEDRILILESLGWFNLSYRRAEIEQQVANVLAEDNLDEAVKDKATIVQKRLAGPLSSVFAP